MAVISLLVTVVVILILCKGAKIQALITGLTLQKSVKALLEGKDSWSRYEYWVIITLLTLILLGVIFLIIKKTSRMQLFRKYQTFQYSKNNAVCIKYICICSS